jgi:ketosteroid isomerase-like protein
MDPAVERQLRNAYEVFLTGDMDLILRGFAPDATFTNPPYAIEGGVRRGLDELRVSFQALHDEFEFRSLDIEELIEGPEGVFAIVRADARGRSSGAPLHGRFYHSWRLRDGLVADFAWYTTLEEGRAAIGLS